MGKGNLQPSVVARPAALGGGARANNIMLPVFEGAIVGNAAYRLSKTLNNVVGVASEYAQRNTMIKNKEQHVKVMNLYNQAGPEMRSYLQNGMRGFSDGLDFANKFTKFNTELLAKYSKDLAPVGKKMLKASLDSKQKNYLGQYQNAYQQHLHTEEIAGKKALLVDSTQDAIAILPLPGAEDVTMLNSIANVQAYMKSQGHADTRATMVKYAKSAGIQLPDNLMTGNLGVYSRMLDKDLAVLKKAEKTRCRRNCQK